MDTPSALEPAPAATPPNPVQKGGPSKVWMVLAILFGVILLAIVGVIGWYWYNFHAKTFDKTELSQPEEEVLATKLEVVSGEPVVVGPASNENRSIRIEPDVAEPTPEPVMIKVSEDGTYERADGEKVPIYDPTNRTVIFTEREINGFLGTNFEDQSKILYIQLSNDQITAKWVVPIPEDAVLFPGKTVRANIRVGAFIDPQTGRLAMMVKDVTVGGVPMPNAWLGDIKNVNLFENAGLGTDQDGFLKRFADGIEDFEVRNGEIRIKLTE